MVSEIKIKVVTALFLVTFIIPCVAALPPVQLVKGGNGVAYKINNHGVVTFPDSAKDMKMAADWLAQQLSDGGNHNWNVVARGNDNRISGDIEIRVMLNDSRIPFKSTDKRYSEAYIIHMGKKIILYAGDVAGALYGTQRLFEMIKDGSLIQSSTIIDYPDYKWRGVYTSLKDTACGDPYWLKKKQKKEWQLCMETLIADWRSMRINSLFVQSPIFYRLNNKDIQLLDNLFRYARRNNIEPVPVLASKLWGIPLDYIKQDAIEGISHKDAEFRAVAGSLVPNSNNIESTTHYKWDIPGNLLFANWHTENSPKEHISINQPVNNDHWKAPVYLKNSAGNIKLKVKPGQYYEFMLSIKSRKYHDARIIVTPIELDKIGREIKGLRRYHAKLFTTENWRKRWIPIFTSQKTYAITLHISAKNISGEKVRIDIENPILIPMKSQLVNVLINDETVPILKSKDGSIQYVNGEDYEVKQAVIKEWRETAFTDIKKTKIRLLQGSKIQDGQQVNISFDTLPIEYRAIPTSKYSAVSRYTYKEYQRIFKRLKWLAPKFIHISMDEHEGGLNRDSRSKKLGLCNRDLYVGYINALDSLLRKQTNIKLPPGDSISGVGMVNTRLIMWDDMVNPWHNGSYATYQVPFGGVIGTTGLLDNVDCNKNIKLHQDVLLADWWYKGNDDRGVVKNSPVFYRKLGYRYFMSTWYQQDGIANWLKSVKPLDTEGVIGTTWGGQDEGVTIMACMAWNRRASKKCMLY